MISFSAIAQPCLQGWTYRVPINVDNSTSAVALSNFQVSFELNTQELIAAGKLNYDGSDLRILSAGGSVLPHWIEKPTFNTPQTRIWVKVASIPANAVETIYAFYGRPAAQNISSGENTFEFFDDFQDVVVNTNKWVTCNEGDFSVANNYLTLSSTTLATEKATMVSHATFTQPVVSEMYVNSVSGSGGAFIGLLSPASYNGYGLFYNASPATTMRMKLFSSDPACFVAANESPSPNAVSALQTQGVWLFAWPQTASQFIDWPGASSHPLTRADATYALPSATAIAIGNMDVNGSVQLDWVRVRKFAEIEPSTSIGVEVASVTSATAGNNGPLCTGQTLQLTASAVAGVQYAWTGPNGFTSGLQNPEIINVSTAMAGTYEVVVSIPSGCSSVQATTEVNISAPTVAGTITGDATVCAGSNTGSILLSGNTGEVRRWEFSNSGAEPWGTINNTSTALSYTNLVATTHFRAVVQNGACEEKVSNTVIIEVSPTTNGGKAIGSTTTCSEENSGIILLSGQIGKVLEWQSSADNWVSINTINETTESLSYNNLTETTQFRAVVQSGVCELKYSEPAVVTVSPLPVVTFAAQAVCDGSPTSFINNSTIASGSISSYLWDFGDGTSSIERNPIKQYLNKGAYTVKLTATSDKGCQAYILKTVTVNEFPVANFSLEDVCFGDPVEVNNSSSYGSGALTYSWNFGDGSTSELTAPSHKYAGPGIYSVKLIVSTELGCEDSLTRYVEVFGAPLADAGTDTAISKGFNVQLSAKGGVDYRWEPITGLSNSNISNPIASPLETTTYTVTVTDENGCNSSDEVTVFVENDYRVYVSNVLTPDGNGVNDTWIIKNIENFGECNVYVFDRWGEEVYSKKAYKNDWNGFRGTDILPDGTYYYLITFEDSNKQYKGALTILRNQ
ncbi:hypothetical protein GCM10011506_44470 [Marivirga lumbricoides]|uniref:PKD domain-containing protein n=2 Tax=Marivirga lumbricoides TaxID=1046115 RepID=A0ABQ1N5K6_9BACT|nr:hypothetical protein GCM10011506_44470 [Marivirga lumbricoides]